MTNSTVVVNVVCYDWTICDKLIFWLSVHFPIPRAHVIHRLNDIQFQKESNKVIHTITITKPEKKEL